jgi:hypothetical protein
MTVFQNLYFFRTFGEIKILLSLTKRKEYLQTLDQRCIFVTSKQTIHKLIVSKAIKNEKITFLNQVVVLKICFIFLRQNKKATLKINHYEKVNHHHRSNLYCKFRFCSRYNR